MAQSSNDQTDTEALWLWEGLPICPWISSAAPLTHIPRPDSQGAYCPLMDSQHTTVNHLIHERISGFNLLIKGQIKQKGECYCNVVHWYRVYLEQINTAGCGRKLLIAGGLKPVASVVEWNRINQIPNSSSTPEATRDRTGLCPHNRTAALCISEGRTSCRVRHI